MNPNWKISSISSIADIYRGASPRPINDPMWFDTEGDVGWVRISDVTSSQKYLFHTTQYLSKSGVSKSRLITPNNIIMSICATVGKPIITTSNVCIHDGFIVFNDPKIDKGYLYYYLRLIEQNWKKYGQTGSQMNLNTDIVKRETISFPESLPEQKKIAEILSTWDEAIELKKQQLKEYENYFNQCLNKMFETRDMKQGLVLGSLIVEENKTKNQSSSRGFSGAYPFFTNSTEEVAKKTDYFDFDGKYIIANTGGRAYFDYFEGKFGAMSDCYVFTTKEINVKYLYYWLKSQEKYIDFVGFVGSGLNHLDKKWFKKLPVPVPTRSRQERIVEALDSINFAREKINKQIDLLMLQKQGLMQRLLTGKVRVKLD